MAFFGKNKMQNLFAILIIVTLAGCRGKEIEFAPGVVTIAGKITNYHFPFSSEKISLTFSQIFQDPQERVQIISENGHFNFKFIVPHNQDVYLSYRQDIPVIVHPGDSIHITFTANDSSLLIPHFIQFSGDRKRENDDLQEYLKYRSSKELLSQKIKFQVQNISSTQFISFADSLRKIKRKVIEDFIIGNDVSDDVINWIWGEEESEYLSMIYSIVSRQAVIHESPGIFHFFNLRLKGPLKKELLLNTKAARFLLFLYLQKYVPFELVGKLSPHSVSDQRDSLTLLNILKEKNDFTRQVVLTQYFTRVIISNKFRLHEKYFSSIITTYLKEPYFRDFLAAKYNRSKPETSHLQHKIIPLIPYFSGRPLPYSLRQHVNHPVLDTVLATANAKALFIQIWSIDYGNSIKRLPYTEALKKKFNHEELECI